MAIAPEQAPDEHVTSFLLPEHHVRGAIVRVCAGVPAMVGRRDAQPDVRRVLGELCAAGPLMAAHLKFDGRLALQIQDGAQISLMLVQVEDNLRTRGMAREHGEAPAGSFEELTRGGVFAVTFEPRSGQSYQALVPLEGSVVAEALEGYFNQSEQLPTRFVLASSGDCLAGLMLQRLPDAGKESEAGWDHARALVDTVSADELMAETPATMLHRLFHGDDLALHDPKPMTMACSCSQARISRMLLSLGEKEVNDILREQGMVTVNCDFCGAVYHYDHAQVQALFSAEHASNEVPPQGDLH